MRLEKPADMPSPIATDAADGKARILLMRHAQTFANASGFFLGRRDEGVTEVGQAQSQRAVEGLVAWKPELIVTSPLMRCRTLIATPAAARLGIDMRVDERLTEFDFGPVEGMSFEDVVARGMPFPWGPKSAQWPPHEGGESFDDFIARVGEAARDIEQTKRRVAVVAHGGVIRGFLAVWLNMSTDDINHLIVRNVDSFVFRSEPGFVELEAFGIHPEDLAAY